MIIVAAPTKKPGFAEPGDDAHQHEPPERVHDAVARASTRATMQRAADDEHAPADPVADPARVRAQRDRADRERADRDADRDAARAERVLDVVRAAPA